MLARGEVSVFGKMWTRHVVLWVHSVCRCEGICVDIAVGMNMGVIVCVCVCVCVRVHACLLAHVPVQSCQHLPLTGIPPFPDSPFSISKRGEIITFPFKCPMFKPE